MKTLIVLSLAVLIGGCATPQIVADVSKQHSRDRSMVETNCMTLMAKLAEGSTDATKQAAITNMNTCKK